MSHKACITAIASIVLLFGSAAQLPALPDYLTTFTRLYSPKTDTALAKAKCLLCHATNQGGKQNPYAGDFAKQPTRDTAAFKAIEKLDSDKDGYSNLDEIKAGTLPGDPASTPAAAAPPPPKTPATPSAPTPAGPATAKYVGVETCRVCHIDQHRQWAQTRHARAFDLLEIAGQAQNPECLSCHTTGYRRGGFRDAAATPGLKGVQCEACHGPGSEHQGDPRKIVKTPPASVCAACHKRLNIH